MVHFRIARHMAVALLCLVSFAPHVFADNTVRSSKNADGSTKWEAVDDDAMEAVPLAQPVVRASGRSGGGKSSYSSGGGGVRLQRNADGSIETFSSGPSGVIPPGGFSDNWSGEPVGGGYSGGDGGGDGVSVTRNADGSIETSSAGPSGTWGGGSGGGTRRTKRHPIVRKATAHHPAATAHHPATAHLAPAGKLQPQVAKTHPVSAPNKSK